MKKALLYLLICSYTIIIIKPVLPSVTDFIAHIFWYSEHMATVHYEHGKYHVHYEYAGAAKKDAGKGNNSSRPEDSSKEHIISNKTGVLLTPQVTKDDFTIFSSALSANTLKNDYPPPRA